MNLQYGGQPVAGFGVGAPDVVGSGLAALQATVAQYSHRITNPSKAVADLQAAGLAAVSTVGPAIEALAGGNPDVMKLTQLAWRQNGQLAAVNSSGATGADVDVAKEIVNQMIAAYHQSARLAVGSAPRSAPASASAPGRSLVPSASPSVPDAPPDGGGFLDWVAAHQTALVVGGVVAAVGSVALAVAASVPRRRLA